MGRLEVRMSALVKELEELGPQFTCDVKSHVPGRTRLRARGVRWFQNPGSAHVTSAWPGFTIMFLPGQKEEAYRRIVERYGEPVSSQKRCAALFFGPYVYQSDHATYENLGKVMEE